MIPGQDTQVRPWRVWIERVGVPFVSLLVLVALLPAPANSQIDEDETRTDVRREGIWIGEAVAFGTLWGTTEGGSALWAGALEMLITFEVDTEGSFTGDWILDGEAVMEVEAPEPIFITQVYDGSGTFFDVPADLDDVRYYGYQKELFLTIEGDVSTSGTAATSIGSINVGPYEHPFESDVYIYYIDCYEMFGNWLNPLRQLASDAGWQGEDLHGDFRVSFVGDEVHHELGEAIDQLWSDMDAWADRMVDTGSVDVQNTFDLLGRSREMTLAMAESEDCIRSLHGDFQMQFTGRLSSGMAHALRSRHLTASVLLDMVTVMGALGFSGAADTIGGLIEEQTQRIIDENVVEGDGCEPCLRRDADGEVLQAAFVGELLGQKFEIDGQKYSPAEVVAAVIGG